MVMNQFSVGTTANGAPTLVETIMEPSSDFGFDGNNANVVWVHSSKLLPHSSWLLLTL